MPRNPVISSAFWALDTQIDKWVKENPLYLIDACCSTLDMDRQQLVGRRKQLSHQTIRGGRGISPVSMFDTALKGQLMQRWRADFSKLYEGMLGANNVDPPKEAVNTLLYAVSFRWTEDKECEVFLKMYEEYPMECPTLLQNMCDEMGIPRWDIIRIRGYDETLDKGSMELYRKYLKRCEETSKQYREQRIKQE